MISDYNKLAYDLLMASVDARLNKNPDKILEKLFKQLYRQLMDEKEFLFIISETSLKDWLKTNCSHGDTFQLIKTPTMLALQRIRDKKELIVEQVPVQN